VRVTIETVLDEGLPAAYTKKIYEAKVAAVFEHVYECYYGTARVSMAVCGLGGKDG